MNEERLPCARFLCTPSKPPPCHGARGLSLPLRGVLGDAAVTVEKGPGVLETRVSVLHSQARM